MQPRSVIVDKMAGIFTKRIWHLLIDYKIFLGAVYVTPLRIRYDLTAKVELNYANWL